MCKYAHACKLIFLSCVKDPGMINPTHDTQPAIYMEVANSSNGDAMIASEEAVYETVPDN